MVMSNYMDLLGMYAPWQQLEDEKKELKEKAEKTKEKNETEDTETEESGLNEEKTIIPPLTLTSAPSTVWCRPARYR